MNIADESKFLCPNVDVIKYIFDSWNILTPEAFNFTNCITIVTKINPEMKTMPLSIASKFRLPLTNR
jgi:hypothetical protein